MQRKFKRKSFGQEKARRKSELNARAINKKKYYGLGVEIDQFKDKLQYHFTHTSVLDQVNDQLPSNIETVSEDFASDTVNRSRLLRGEVEDVLDDLEEPLANSFEKGGRRAFNSNGDTLPSPDNFEERVDQILQEQRNYITKLDQDLREKAVEVIRAGVAAGLAKSQIVENLRSELKNLIENRSSTVANSEVVKAGVGGMMATFAANDVENVTWVSARDDTVCKPGNFRITIGGTTYTSCRELDGETFALNSRIPEPLLHSHPNCRCILVSND